MLWCEQLHAPPKTLFLIGYGRMKMWYSNVHDILKGAANILMMQTALKHEYYQLKRHKIHAVSK